MYTADDQLISEFGEKRRSPLTFEQIPNQFVNALLASEDDGFYEHYGIDVKGLLRATLELIRTGRKKSGGSTITMQVAKNYYLSSEKSFTRKFTEILLAIKIEKTLTKQEILELYVNKIYLGKRAYGIEAAAQVYYGKAINELTLAQTAMIAGLPQAPSAANPINNPDRAVNRRNYVLSRMASLNMISQADFETAAAEPITARYHGATSAITAPYIAEMVRQFMVEHYGDNAYTDGYIVHTTVDARRQEAATRALQRGLLNYDRAHGYRQKESFADTIAVSPNQTTTNNLPDWFDSTTADPATNWPETLADWQQQLRSQKSQSRLIPAIVADVKDDGAWMVTANGFRFLPLEGIKWAAPYVSVNVVGKKPATASQRLSRRQKIWFEDRDGELLLAQPPEVEGALVSINPNTGAIQALVGGFSQDGNQFNRVLQADRQPGSSFKPFIYSAALENGFTPASIINDAPVVFNDSGLENTWRPENYSGKFYGPTRLRQALYKSQNLVSIRILKQIGPANAVDYITRFGFPKAKLGADLSLALGSSAISPIELATGYSVLANGGFAVKPYFIQRITTTDGDELFAATPEIACRQCDNSSANAPAATINDQASTTAAPETATEPTLAPRVMDKRTNFLMVNMLKDVIQRGTGRRARALNRHDLAGKTGTTNDQVDAWFSGFNPNLVTTVWVGFDQPRSMGKWALGGSTALPIWIDYMATALETEPQVSMEQPDGIVSTRIDPQSGLLAAPGQEDAIFEYFRTENVPTEMVMPTYSDSGNGDNGGLHATPELLF
ncbi:penicillin-binding protein 1A [Oceanobacter sp. 5_MG-2023]|uniref:penicillin-binding protein 1A n=1 Tax=Oceanobacter sp. 5_MG-2023 TaxID=3062645 RepID=UPI0026E2FE75|nr:penicillin-binding protein 1A [Oceanobacter sp. 5_MG-2023]MDO6682857.1 penicillin-binding protein 1A [Oceanobacter sp. 5_MG-2023]